MKVDVKTPDGEPMTAAAAIQPVGSALRIAPEFVVTSSDDQTGVETTIEAHYDANEGRYIPTTIVSRGTAPGFSQYALRHTAPQAILQVAIPQCIAVQLGEDPSANWVTIADLTSVEGRIVPDWMAAAVVKHGVRDERWEVVEIIYGAAALSDLPPVKAISLELNVPHRTASDWIKKARAAGRLKGMSYTSGRQADG